MGANIRFGSSSAAATGSLDSRHRNDGQGTKSCEASRWGGPVPWIVMLLLPAIRIRFRSVVRSTDFYGLMDMLAAPYKQYVRVCPQCYLSGNWAYLHEAHAYLDGKSVRSVFPRAPIAP